MLLMLILGSCSAVILQTGTTSGYLGNDYSSTCGVTELNCNFHKVFAGSDIYDTLTNCYKDADKVLAAKVINSSLETLNANVLEYSRVGEFSCTEDKCNISNSSVQHLAARDDTSISRSEVYLESGSNVFLNLTDAKLVISALFDGELRVQLVRTSVIAEGFGGTLTISSGSAESNLNINAYGVKQVLIKDILSATNIYMNVSATFSVNTIVASLIGRILNSTIIYIAANTTHFYQYELNFTLIGETNNANIILIRANVNLSTATKQDFRLIKTVTATDNVTAIVSLSFSGINYLVGNGYSIRVSDVPAQVQGMSTCNLTLSFVENTEMGNLKVTTQYNETNCSNNERLQDYQFENAIQDPIFAFATDATKYGYFVSDESITCIDSKFLDYNSFECVSASNIGVIETSTLYFALFGVFLLLFVLFLVAAIVLMYNAAASARKQRTTENDVARPTPSEVLDQELLSQNPAYTEDVVISKRPDTFQEIPLYKPEAKKSYGFRYVPDVEDSSDDEDYMKIMNEQMKIQQETVKNVYKGEELYDNANIFRYTMKNKGRERLERVTLDNESVDGTAALHSSYAENALD